MVSKAFGNSLERSSKLPAKQTDKILGGILVEIADTVGLLKPISPHKTRADYLRMIRAACEILPAVPKDLDSGDVYERPRGVEYK
jgi:hypothetical protein